MLQRRPLISACAVLIVVAMSVQATGQVTGDLESLKLVAKTYRANLGKIDTWKGRVRSTTYRSQNGDDPSKSGTTTDFFLRVSSQQLCSLRTFPETGTKLNCLVSDGRFYDRNDNGTGQAEVQVSPFTKELTHVETSCFNPMRYFGVDGEDLAARFMFFFDNADNPKMYPHWEVTREKNIVTVGYSIENESRRDEYVVDLDRGANLVRFSMVGDRASTVHEWEFVEQDGIWVPQWYKYSDRAQFKIVDGKRIKTDEEQHSRTRTIEWLESELNTELPDSDFQLAKLGVTNGTLIHDQLAGVYYRYNAVAEDEPARVGLRTYFIVANVIIVFGLIAALVWRRHAHAPA